MRRARAAGGVIAAASALAAPPAAAVQNEAVPVDRFVAACVNGEIRDAGLREIALSDLPAGIRARYRSRPPGRYYRFDEGSPSYLILVNDARPDAEYHVICGLASRAGGPWSLFSAVMSRLRPATRSASSRPDAVPRHARTMAAGMTNHEQGYAIQAERVAGFTVVESLQFRPKVAAAPSPAAAKE